MLSDAESVDLCCVRDQEVYRTDVAGKNSIVNRSCIRPRIATTERALAVSPRAFSQPAPTFRGCLGRFLGALQIASGSPRALLCHTSCSPRVWGFGQGLYPKKSTMVPCWWQIGVVALLSQFTIVSIHTPSFSASSC